jgi:hypothetical protein
MYKFLLSFLLLFTSLFISAQSKKATKQKQDPVCLCYFKKEVSYDTTKYHVSDSVWIHDGRGESVRIFAEGNIPKTAWDSSVINYKKDYLLFSAIIYSFHLSVSTSVVNKDSYIPYKNQTISWIESGGRRIFASLFKFSARNGYGNLIESSTLVTYTPR